MTTEIQAVDFETALKRIVQTSNSDSLLAKGIHEVAKALESKDEKVKAKYVILAKNCTEANYVKIVKGLAAQNKVILSPFRSMSMKLKPEKPSENGSESASTTRTETSPKRENAPQLLLEIFQMTLRKRKRKFSWLNLANWADDDCIYALKYNQSGMPSCAIVHQADIINHY